MEKYRTLVPRFCALILDIILLLPLGILEDLIRSSAFSQPLKWTLFFIISLAYIVYFVVMHGLFGQTVGKMLMKVKVLDVSEAPIKFRQAILRDFPQLFITVGSFIFLYPLSQNDIDPNSPGYWNNPFVVLMLIWGIVDTFAPLTNDKRRAMHDYLARTVVVRTNQNSEAEDLAEK